MGFIEDERRKQVAAEESRRKEGASAGSAKEPELHPGALIKIQSGLSGMIGELKQIGSIKSEKCFFDGPRGTTYLTELYFKEDFDPDLYKCVFIKITPDGTITFGSDRSHNQRCQTILSRDQWQGKDGRERVEQALGKAFANPDLLTGPGYDHKYGISQSGGYWSRGEGDSN